MLAMLAFSDPQDIGYDPTFILSPVIPQSIVTTKKLRFNLSTIEVNLIIYTIVYWIFFSCLICG